MLRLFLHTAFRPLHQATDSRVKLRAVHRAKRYHSCPTTACHYFCDAPSLSRRASNRGVSCWIDARPRLLALPLIYIRVRLQRCARPERAVAASNLLHMAAQCTAISVSCHGSGDERGLVAKRAVSVCGNRSPLRSERRSADGCFRTQGAGRAPLLIQSKLDGIKSADVFAPWHRLASRWSRDEPTVWHRLHFVCC